MTLLSICQDAAVELGLPEPVAIFGNMSVNEARLLRFAQRVGADLATRAPWQALRMLRSFTPSATETQTGVIPTGFQRFLSETMWDATNGTYINGPVSATEYQSRSRDIYSVGRNAPSQCFTRRGDVLLFWPAPVGNETFVFEYQSSNFCQSASGTPQSAWMADTDTARISEELFTLGIIARFLSADGQPAQVAMADYERRLVTEIRNDAPAANVMQSADIFGGGRRFGGAPGDIVGSYVNRVWDGWSDTWSGA